jgi:fructose-1,6-bisphosphatase/inositol monophosphatase family enzyme
MPKLAEKAGLASLMAAAGVGLYLFQQRNKRKVSKYAIPESLLSLPLSKELRVAVDLALQAGRAMYSYCDEKGTAAEEQHDLGIATKGQAEDFCTKIDLENEILVTEGLMKHFPSHKVIGEEAIGAGSIPPLTIDPTWIIDPIDGTTNFAAGLPLACVSIGLCLDGRPALGVVYAPMTDELYLAVKEHGSYRNGVRITKRKEKSLLESVVCFEFGYARDKDAIAKMLGVVQRILEHGCRTTRSIGSGVLDLCYVATGRIDVVYAGVAGEGWKPWDYCAGYLVAKEAGCAIEPITGQQEGDDFDLYSKSIICAVGLTLLQEVRHYITSR